MTSQRLPDVIGCAISAVAAKAGRWLCVVDSASREHEAWTDAQAAVAAARLEAVLAAEVRSI